MSTLVSALFWTAVAWLASALAGYMCFRSEAGTWTKGLRRQCAAVCLGLGPLLLFAIMGMAAESIWKRISCKVTAWFTDNTPAKW